MTNYICINGKKAELTEEQMKALGIELPKANPFDRAERNKNYYAIDTAGVVRKCCERGDGVDGMFYSIGNYCADKEIMEQRALHETLNRLLWRYSMEHDGDKINWSNFDQKKYHIFMEADNNRFHIDHSCSCYGWGRTHFYSHRIAEAAIEEVIKPFMAAHPEFKF